MTDLTIEADDFGRTLTELLGRVETGVQRNVEEPIEHALQVGQRSWKTYARAVLSKSYSRGGWGKKKTVRTKSGRISKATHWYGKTIRTGKYARSIRHQLTSKGAVTEGEVGSPTMPGLAHLLEKGHGYYPAAPHVHIAPASDEAFRDAERGLGRAVERAINDA